MNFILSSKLRTNKSCLYPGFYTFAHIQTVTLTTQGYTPITGEIYDH